MELRLYNTMARAIQVFKPLSGNAVRLYCCGPTVYHFAHIGNLRTYVFEDLLRRSLQLAGYSVHHVMNITDVGHLTDDGDDGEDKMIKASRERGLNVWDIAAEYTKFFFEDCAKLNVSRPETVCPATDHIADMIELIQKLEQAGMTYIANGNVYYDVSKFPYYNELGQLDKQELRAGTTVAIDEGKRNPSDFVLWFTNSKFKDQAMVWDSPWGRGYPGWHIECSAMSHKYLGDQFDIHCGGVDHIKVHHTNEIAQTEAATGKHPWVNIWMHGEFLNFNNSKMSKSSGEILTVDRLKSLGFEPLDYRYFLLGAHYRTQLNFTDTNMEAARSARNNLLDRIKAMVLQAESVSPGSLRAQTRAAFIEAEQRFAHYASTDQNIIPICSASTLADGEGGKWPALGSEARGYFNAFLENVSDDLNLPRVLAGVFEVLKSTLAVGEKLRLIHIMDQVMGLDLLWAVESRILSDERSANTDSGFTAEEAAEIRAMLQERVAARAAKNFARSDEIRDQLKARGIVLVDTPTGTTFKRL